MTLQVPPDQNADKSGPDKICTEAMERFRLSEDAESDQRREGLAAIRFGLAGEQWDNGITNNRTLEGRPCLTIDRTSPAVRQVTNDMRQNRPQIKVSPTDDSEIDVAEVREGMIRHIQVANNSDVAVDMGAKMQVVSGLGYMRVTSRYVNDRTFDQELVIRPVKNRFSVYDDPYAQEVDRSDRNFCFIVEDMPRKEFQRKWPKAMAGSSDFEAIGDWAPNWAGADTVRVAEYWTREPKEAEWLQLEDGTELDSEELAKIKKDAEGIVIDGQPLVIPEIKKRRPLTKYKVCMYKITATDVLETHEWPGKYIPLVAIIGEEIILEGKTLLRGMVFGMMDPQRQYNYMSSAMTEAVALAPKAPWLIAEGQDEGYELEWAKANQGSPARMVYKPTTINGVLVEKPARIVAEPPVQALAMCIRQSSDDMNANSGIYNPSKGQGDADQSGRAILALQKKGDVSNFHFPDNLTRALRFLGVILDDLIPYFYDAPRIARIVHRDGSHDTVPINQPSGQKGEDGVEKVFDMSEPSSNSIVMETGPDTATKREASAQGMLELMKADPNLMAIAGDLLVKELDWPNAQPLSERLKRALPPQLQDPPDGSEPVSPQMRALQTQNQQLTKALQEATHAIQTKAIEMQSKEKIENDWMNTEMAKEQMKAQTAAFLAETKNHFGAFTEELKHLRENQAMIMQHVQSQQSFGLQQQAQQQAAAQPQQGGQ